MSFEGEVVCRLSNTDTYNDYSLQLMGFIRVDGHWTKGRGPTVEEEEERVEGEGPSSPPELRQRLDVHFVSKLEVGPSVSAPLSISRIVPSSLRLGEDEMGLLAEWVAGILSI